MYIVNDYYIMSIIIIIIPYFGVRDLLLNFKIEMRDKTLLSQFHESHK